ncbi:MAG: STAS domain-containing protein [Candidatus Dormibacteraeota bacterium]|nr:STAS domain-containing protein [Candidatus Dormibacteraeota bacterium]
METRAALGDRCPYSRSFSPAFADQPACSAYQAMTFVVTDMSHRALGAALTCRHLTVGADTAHPGRYYPRCGLGAMDRRERWLAGVTPARLEVMRSLDDEFELLLASDRLELLEAKARVLLAPDEDPEPLEELEAMLGRFLDRTDGLIAERSARLADVGLSDDALRLLLHDWSLAWLRSRDVFPPHIADMPLAGISPQSAALLGGNLAPDGGQVGGTVVFTAGALTVERVADPPHVRLRGQIDVANSEALVTGVMAAAGDTDEILVDFGDVLFCDVSGLRALVMAAAELGGSRRIVLANLPAELRRAVTLVGWAKLPGLAVLGLDGDDPGP